MGVCVFCRGIISGEGVMVYEMRHQRDGYHTREFEFANGVTRESIRFYEVDVDGALAMKMDVGLGFFGNNLGHVLIYVTTVGDMIPNQWGGHPVNVLGEIVLLYVSTLADMYADRMDSIPFWRCILDPPLVGRPYLHGEVRS
ncbi:hypothetical protein CBR_g40967 [Chara braunii]|uniref:Uncharacterized protein n=1 Tax=Chara braunii TaxID=69332 RepID=A0A388LUR6_CHABU|nr:hypothetical protein CBR_g40967 [Chara braunii]|eukprot:GBG86066.1 hypothetical protein CBR_g40967 [Chara braunii]